MIDWGHVDELRGDLGPEFGELVSVFLAEVDDAMARLRPEDGPEALSAGLHFLKGAALNLGFRAFASACAAGEEAAAAGQRIDMAAIRACEAASRHEFLTGLQKRRVA